ncbi:MAG: hypothetical protein WD058_08570 [Dehalococcoidia bacterium]
MRNVRVWGIGLLAVMALGFLAACGGEEEGGVNEFRRGGAEVEEAVDGFISGWRRGSGPARDTIAASQTRRYLNLEGPDGDRIRSAVVGGSSSQPPLEGVFNEVMGVPFPPDGDPLYEITESVQDSDTEATITVSLNYTENAASALAAQGVLDFSEVQSAQEQVNGGVTRTFRLAEDPELGWQITNIEGAEESAG